MKQIERIRLMEQRLDEVTAAVNALQQALDNLDAAQCQFNAALPSVRELSDYYDGPLWKKDYADDEAGLLPRDLKRGVLSEDAVWNLLNDVRELGERLKKEP